MRRSAHSPSKDQASSPGAPASSGQAEGVSFTDLLDGMADELGRRAKDRRTGMPDPRPAPALRPAASEHRHESDERSPGRSRRGGQNSADASRSAARGDEHPGGSPASATGRAASPVLNEAIAHVSQRLDDLHRRIGGLRPASASAREERRDEPQPRYSDDLDPPGARLDAVLRGFEERITEGAAPAGRGPRASGRRGSDKVDDVRSAVVAIRSRQRELDRDQDYGRFERAPVRADRAASSEGDMLSSVRGEVSRLASQLDGLRGAPANPSAPALAALQDELTRLQSSLANLATRGDVGAIEKVVRELGREVSRARAPGDANSGLAPLDALRSEVERMSGDIAANVHGRISRDVERLSRKLDIVANSVPDSSTIQALSRQLPDMERKLDDLGELRRVAEVLDRVSALSGQLAEIRTRQADEAVGFASLEPALDNIRLDLERSRAAAAQAGPEMARQVETLGRKIDDLRNQTAAADLGALSKRIETLASAIDSARIVPDELIERIEVLSSRVEQVAAMSPSIAVALDRLSDQLDGGFARSVSDSTLETVLARLDRIDERLRRKPGNPQSIEEMLRSLADKLEEGEATDLASAEALDGLEKQVRAISSKLTRGAGRDPALASLERAMGDLMNQVANLREPGSEDEGEGSTAAKPEASGGDPGLERDILPLGGPNDAGDQRLQGMLDSVQSALENLDSRFAALEQGSAKPALDPASGEPLELDASSAIRRTSPEERSPRSSRPQSRNPSEALASAVGPERLIEPGSGRPRPKQASAAAPEARAADPADVKANFIAAARRAAQTAAAEASRQRVAPRPDSLSRPSRSGEPRAAGARAAKTFASRRRQALLGLAAVVLALGALQSKSEFVTQKLAEIGALSPWAKSSRPATELAVDESAAPNRQQAGSGSTVGQVTDPARRPVMVASAAPASDGAEAGPALPSSAESRSASLHQPIPTIEEARIESPPASPALPSADSSRTGPVSTGSIEPPPAKNAPTRVTDIVPAEIPAAPDAPGLRQAVLSGDPIAVFELAARAAEGRGIPRDLKLSAKLFEKAAASGVAPAQYRIGNQYEKGLGVTRDIALAKQWYRRAAESGNAKAMHNLAVLLAEGGGSAPDYSGAATWFKSAAEHGVRDSQYNLAVLFARGLGLKQDLAQSYTWFAIAAGQGDVDAGKKRDEVGDRLPAPALAAAREAAERWKAQAPDQTANEVVLPPGGWAEVLPPKKPAAPKKA